jgi:5-methylcytosine-specific restriction endonuclease McrA
MTAFTLPSVINEAPNKTTVKAMLGNVRMMDIAVKVSKTIHMRCRLAEAQSWRCCWCGDPCIPEPNTKKSATIEHVTPRSMGGTDEWENLAMACADCNHRRGVASIEDMMAGLVTRRKATPNRVDRLVAKSFRKYRITAIKLRDSGWVRGDRVIDPEAWLSSLPLNPAKRQELVLIIRGEVAE